MNMLFSKLITILTKICTNRNLIITKTNILSVLVAAFITVTSVQCSFATENNACNTLINSEVRLFGNSNIGGNGSNVEFRITDNPIINGARLFAGITDSKKYTLLAMVSGCQLNKLYISYEGIQGKLTIKMLRSGHIKITGDVFMHDVEDNSNIKTSLHLISKETK